MKSVDIKDLNYQIDTITMETVEIAPVLYAQFTEMVKKIAPQVTKKRSFMTLLNAQRFIEQTVFIGEDKKRYKLDAASLMKLSIPVSRRLLPLLAEDEGTPGKIVKEGDGVSSPIIYKLGTPIKTAEGKLIEELEFFAQTYGEIEDLLSEDLMHNQVMVLISKLARPVASTLQALPGWAVEQITMADGMTLGNKVLPGFLGSGTTSSEE